MLVIDNASFYHSERVKGLYFRAGIKLVFLPLYSLDLNLIKEFFKDLKHFIRRN